MKKINFVSTLLLVVMALPFLFSCSKDDDDEERSKIEDIKVVVYENGKTSNGSIFSAIDDTNFYLDYIKYSVDEDGSLVVRSYDKDKFKGAAKIVYSITYKGNTYVVRRIGDCAFYQCYRMTSVTIPSSVSSIGESAFFFCSGLTSIVIPNSIRFIDWQTFKGCSSLTSVTISNSVTYISPSAFALCDRLSSIHCLNITPPEIGYNLYTNESSFEHDTYSQATLYVPQGSIYVYKTSDSWKSFKKIVEE